MLSLFRSNCNDHALSLYLRKLFGLAQFFQLMSEPCQQRFALIFEEDGTSFKEHISLYFISFFQEFFGMIEFKIKIMIIGLRSKQFPSPQFWQHWLFFPSPFLLIENF